MGSLDAKGGLVREPAVAGRFYPGSREVLGHTVDAYLRHAETPPLSNVKALIAPHAGYECSGPVAGHAFATCYKLRDSMKTVYLVGPAHWARVAGIGLACGRWFETPLGRIEIDVEEVERLLALGQPFVEADDAHAPEHCLEVELPFLQRTLGEFKIVPMLLGTEVDWSPLVNDLEDRLGRDSDALLVASSDLSHYLPHAEAQHVDAAFLERVMAGDTEGVRVGEACGRLAIATTMDLAERLGWSPRLLAYATSGDTCGSADQVVGYCAIAYTESPS